VRQNLSASSTFRLSTRARRTLSLWQAFLSTRGFDKAGTARSTVTRSEEIIVLRLDKSDQQRVLPSFPRVERPSYSHQLCSQGLIQEHLLTLSPPLTAAKVSGLRCSYSMVLALRPSLAKDENEYEIRYHAVSPASRVRISG